MAFYHILQYWQFTKYIPVLVDANFANRSRGMDEIILWFWGLYLRFSLLLLKLEYCERITPIPWYDHHYLDADAMGMRVPASVRNLDNVYGKNIVQGYFIKLYDLT